MEYKYYTRDEVYFNSKQKIYPDGSKKIINCNDYIFKDKYFEDVEVKEKISKPKNMSNDVRNDSIKRARENIFDIAICNDFKYFITWTLDGSVIDRYNPLIVKEKLLNFLHNMQKRYELHYLIVPEYHQDGAIHIHGLINGNILLTDSGKTVSDGRIIYNMPQWKYGFSSAIELVGDRSNIAKYITKYISKDFRKIFGKFYYAGGNFLVRHPYVKLVNVDYDNIDIKEYNLKNSGLKFKYEWC